MKFESNVKNIPHPQGKVYAKLSNLNNLAEIVTALKDPQKRSQLSKVVPEEKLESAERSLDSLRVDSDSVSVNVPPVGEIGFKIAEREPDKCIKLESTKSPLGLKMWIQILPVTESGSKMKLTVDADVNPFLGAIVSKPIKEGVEKIADMLSVIPYE
ncbi:MAG: SRPBCC family protein [Bacteroidaceae bacterium]|nr:SRPBCC family protein [Bacteroidaceae bacterium]